MFCKAIACLLVALPVVAQAQTFTTVTISPARSADPSDERIRLQPDGEWIASGVSMIRLMSSAYDVPVNGSPRVSSLPNWTVFERYDIKAQAPANAISRSIPAPEIRNRVQR